MAATEMQTHHLKRGNWIDVGEKTIEKKDNGDLNLQFHWSSGQTDLRGGDFIDIAVTFEDSDRCHVIYSRKVYKGGAKSMLRRPFAAGIGLSEGDEINIWIRPTEQPSYRSMDVSDYIPCGMKEFTKRSDENQTPDGLAGKVTIPYKTREAYDIEHNDVVVVVMAFDHTTFSFRSFVDVTGGITVPGDLRMGNKIEAGDECDWWVRKEDTPIRDDGIEETEPKSDNLQQFMKAAQEDEEDEEDSTRSDALEEIPDDPEVIKLRSADDDVHYVTNQGRSTVCGKEVPPDSPTALESELGVFDDLCPACDDIGPIPYDRDQLQKRIREICGLDADGMEGMELQNDELYDVLRVLTED